MVISGLDGFLAFLAISGNVISLSPAGSPELERQPLAICPSAQPAQQSAPQEEEVPRAEESALTSDPPLSDCRATPVSTSIQALQSLHVSLVAACHTVCVCH